VSFCTRLWHRSLPVAVNITIQPKQGRWADDEQSMYYIMSMKLALKYARTRNYSIEPSLRRHKRGFLQQSQIKVTLKLKNVQTVSFFFFFFLSLSLSLFLFLSLNGAAHFLNSHAIKRAPLTTENLYTSYTPVSLHSLRQAHIT